MAQQSEHTKRSDPTFTSPSSQRHSDVKSRPYPKSSLCIERSLLQCTKSIVSTATKLLELLHMDLMGSRVGESIERKKFIYVEAICTICLYLEQLPVGTLINPYGIKRRMTDQIKYRVIHPTGGTCSKRGFGHVPSVGWIPLYLTCLREDHSIRKHPTSHLED